MRALRIAAFLFLLVLPAFGQNYTIQQYLNIKSASSPSMSPDGREVAYLSNVTGTTQVWATLISSPKPVQLTNYEDNVSFVRWLSDGSGMIFGKAKGGDENTQFYWMDKFGQRVKPLTNDPAVRHNFELISRDAAVIAYSSNKRNRNYFDIYAMDIASGREVLLYQQDGDNSIVALSDNGRQFIISRSGGELSLDNNLYLVDAKTKTATLLTPHTEAAQFGNARFTADGIIYTHNDKREFIGLAQMRQKNAAGDDWSLANLTTSIIDDAKWDIGDVEMETSGGHIAYSTNREGFSEVFLRKVETDGKPLITTVSKAVESIKLPAPGIVSGLNLDTAETKLAFAFSSATSSGEIWVYDLETKSLKQITKSDQAGIDPKSFIAPELIKYKSFDGLEIPAWYYRPEKTVGSINGKAGKFTIGVRPKANLPVIVSVHGGPEGQSRPGFNPLFQYYLSRGYAVLDLNVRGSTGYGKTYTHLDDVEKREDSVKDLAYSVEWLKTKGGADPKKVAVMGGSYGGYMTMAAITLYPDLWAAAVASVAITNWETFLTNTSGYRRRQREVEYGRLDKDIEFLRRISPIRKIDLIKTPLFVISGRNDPRVPFSEGEQMVDALKKRGAPVQYKLYDDEGHGISKLKNRLDLYPLVADFLDKYMK
ncbi:MAG: S9 family peptidase [Pyrinomonadaceae bacterium]|nr:S9 family peptidase [Pyrinomonadaceae bacterium]MBP6214231.1 S9 family peptidase [Pyrinomonadaceae bacterium]